MFDSLFSSSNRYKGKFSPLPSHRNIQNSTHIKSPPGPTTYFQNSIPTRKLHTKPPPPLTRTHSPVLTHIGPASYKPHLCPRSCSKKKRINAHISIYLLRHIACQNSKTKRRKKKANKKNQEREHQR